MTDSKDEAKTLPPPHLVNIPFGHNWSVVTPSVYRYENQNWIDEFFETGRLRLSSFAKFATYPDEIRGDKSEGTGFCYGETADGKSVIVVQTQGISSAVLCCSHKLDHKLREGFERESAFQILNTVGFGAEIARQLPGFQSGLEGSCIYRSKKMIKRKIEFDMEKYKRSDGMLDARMLADAGNALGGPELLLLKSKKYEVQQEYRILWNLDAISGEFVDVVAPRARQFCRRVNADDFDS